MSQDTQKELAQRLNKLLRVHPSDNGKVEREKRIRDLARRLSDLVLGE